MSIFPILLRLKPEFPELAIQDFYTYRTVAGLEAYLSRNARDTNAVVTSATVDRVVQPAKPMQTGDHLPSAVLLTGATGFLGSHLLKELLDRTSAHVYCLVRANERWSAEERLADVMRFYFGEKWAGRMETRVSVLQGDLAVEGLGLSKDDRAVIEQVVDSIFHCGADVRHYGDEAEFVRVNVQGTEQLLAFAKRPGVRFHLVSTLSTATWAPAGVEEYVVVEESCRPSEQTAGNVYVKSKWSAEELVRQAIEQGYDAAIYRVGNLIGHSEHGKFQRNVETNAFYRYIKAVLLLGAAGENRHEIDLTPIDFCSRALLHLGCRRESAGQTWHVCNPVGIPGDVFVDLLRGCGYPIQLLKADAYMAWLHEVEPTSDVQEGKELMMAHLLAAEGDGPVLRFDNSRTMQVLAQAGIACHKPDQQLVTRMIEYIREIGFVPAPANSTAAGRAD